MTIVNPGENGRYESLFSGLVAAYDFKNNAKDWSGNGNDGTVTGATLTTDRFGISNSAYSFDGTNDIIAEPAFSATFQAPKSIIITFNVTSISAGGANPYENNMLVSWGNVFWAIELIQSTNKIRYFYYDGASQSWDSTSTINTGTWYHLVIVNKSGGSEMFLNGVSIGTSSLTLLNNIGVSRKLSFGGNSENSATHYFYNGIISKSELLNREVSAAEAKQLYDLESKKDIYTYMRDSQ